MLNLQGKQTASLVPPDSESPDPVAVQGRRRCHNGGVPQRTVAQQVADRRVGYLATRSGFGSRCPWLPQSTDASGPFWEALTYSYEWVIILKNSYVPVPMSYYEFRRRFTISTSFMFALLGDKIYSPQ
nr:uncharacterized protein LOC108008613 [Drosophila suzukii]